MSKQDPEFQKKLDQLSCPFTWNIDKAITSYYTMQKLERKEEDGDIDCSLPINNMMSALMTCYQEIIKNNMEKAEEKLKEANQYLKDIKQLNSKELDGSMRSFEHVLDATKCHILYKQKNVKEAEKILVDLVNVSSMTRKELGALDGIQSAAWSLYHDFGKDKAVELAGNAVRLNPENAFWHFILGKNLRRNRRIVSVSSSPGKTETESFEKAYNISKQPSYGVYLAQMYRERMYRSTYKSREEKANNEKKIFEIYKEIIKSDDVSAYVLSRITLGLIRMNTINTCDMAQQCLNILEKKTENHILYSTYVHYKALYLEKFEPYNVTERLKYFKAAAEWNNFPADLSYAETGMQIGMDPLEHLQKMLIKYADAVKERQQVMHLAIGTCYYLKYDMKKAAEHYLKALEIDPNAQKLKMFYKFGTFKPWKKTVYDFLMNEFLPKLHSASDASANEKYLKIKQICLKHMKGGATSLDDYMKNMKL